MSLNVEFLVIVMMMITAITIITIITTTIIIIIVIITIILIIIIRIAEQAAKGRQMDLLVIYKWLDEVLAYPQFCSSSSSSPFTIIIIIIIVIIVIITIILITTIRIAEQAVTGRQMDLLVIYKSFDEVLDSHCYPHHHHHCNHVKGSRKAILIWKAHSTFPDYTNLQIKVI